MNVSLSTTPAQAAKNALQRLPAKRMREVLERRFGLKSSKRETLEDIGGSFRITRERVRQIEADALRRLRAEAADEQRDDFFGPIEETLSGHGSVMSEPHLFETVAYGRFHPHLRFLLHTTPRVTFFPETDAYHARWALDTDAARRGEQVVTRVTKRLDEKGRPVSKESLYEMLMHDDTSSEGAIDAATAEAYLRTSRVIGQNPYSEYGLVSWATISPRGIRDKAYTVLAKKGSPMHFRDVAAGIDRAGWSKRKKAHPQTVHNELIKDERFVLVGRGLYALREWGYEPGTVRDVLVTLFKQSNRPLARQEVVELATEKRLVKPQTILLNLQDRDLFRRTDDGKYTLV